MSKIGLLLGSFDPPHVGHLELCTLVLNNCDIKEVFLVPAWQNPWKKSTPYEDRYMMCRHMTTGLFGIMPIDIERQLVADPENPLFTAQVLEAFPRFFPNDDFYVITTKETWNEMDRWKDGNIIKEKCKFLREGIDFPEHSFNIHSSDIRQLIKERKRVIPYVTSEVYKYMYDNELYEGLTFEDYKP